MKLIDYEIINYLKKNLGSFTFSYTARTKAAMFDVVHIFRFAKNQVKVVITYIGISVEYQDYKRVSIHYDSEWHVLDLIKGKLGYRLNTKSYTGETEEARQKVFEGIDQIIAKARETNENI